MEPTRFYELDYNGYYCVRFANKTGLTVDQISEIFKKWGNVVSVAKAGDDYGFRFVRYKNEDEVKRCIEETRNHPTIKLLPKRPKQSNNENQNGGHGQRRKNNWSNEKEESKAPWESQKSEILEKPHSVQTRLDRIRTILATSEDKDISDNSKIVEKSEELQEAFFSKSESESILQNPEIHRDTASKHIDVEYCKAANFPEEEEPSKSPEKIILVPLTVKISSRDSFSSAKPEVIVSEISELVSNQTHTKNAASHQILDMTPSQREKYINAEEIVVANIPAEISVNYLLHLFRKHEPICVSAMKFVPSLAIRFCVIFFPTAQQATAVEAEFDNYVLDGKSLMVLRPQSLRRIAESA